MRKAVEFIKKNGWNEAYMCAKGKSDLSFELVSGTDFRELKRLVESHELVSKFGCLAAARYKADRMFDMMLHTQSQQLKQAIADVESCQ